MCGRRSGKTFALAVKAVATLLSGETVMYLAPTEDQTRFFVSYVKQMLDAIEDSIKGKIFHHSSNPIVFKFLTNNEGWIRARTARDPNNLRGGTAHLILVDELQLLTEDIQDVVVPMTVDFNAQIIYALTPFNPLKESLGKDKAWANKFWRECQKDDRFECVRFPTTENPHISKEAIDDMKADLTSLGWRIEGLAEDIQERLGALWTLDTLKRSNELFAPVAHERIAIGVDPAGSTTGTTGIIVVGKADDMYTVLADRSVAHGTVKQWTTAVANAYDHFKADIIIAEKNFGGDMVKEVLDSDLPVQVETSTRGKHVRADPVALLYEQNRVKHTPDLAELEDQMITWVPGDRKSPDRIDGLCFAINYLNVEKKRGFYYPGLS